MKRKLFKWMSKRRVQPIPLKTNMLVSFIFIFFFWVLGRILLVAHYGWSFEVILLLDIWLLPLFDIVRDIAKQAEDKQEGPGKPKNNGGRL